MSSPSSPLNPDTNSSDEGDEIGDDRTLLSNEPIQDTKQCMKARTVLGLMGFLGFANVYAMRVNLSVAIVAMVNSSSIPDNSNSTFDVCPIDDLPDNSTIVPSTGEFNWTETQQGLILGSFFYGYVLTQVPGGRIAEMFGGKKVFGLGVLFTAIFTILSPIVVRSSFVGFIVIRVLEGLAEGVTFPSMHAMLAKWIPPNERSKFAAIVYAGSNFGSVISLPASAWLCTLKFDGGWPLCFYIFGGIGLIWFLAWMFLVYDTPQSHPRICDKELNYIMWSTKSNLQRRSGSVPWKNLFCSVPLWAILVTQCGIAWQFYTLLTELPIYMNNILHMNIERNAMIAAVPYFTSWIAGIVISIFADWLLSKQYISQINSYKLWNTIGSLIPSLGLLGVAWAGCDQLSVFLLLSLTGAFTGAQYSGNQMNHIALSPQYAGTMYGLTNGAANLCGFLAPSIIGFIIEGKETLSQWRVVFYLAVVINLSCNLFYLVFASAEEEKWSVLENQSHLDNTESFPSETSSALVS